MRVLIVDDDPLMSRVLTTVLDGEGYHVAEARCAGDALVALAEQGPFDVLVTDLGLEDMDGTELARRAMSLYPRLVVVMMSSGPVTLLLREQSRWAFLRKPFNVEELRRALRWLVGQQAARRRASNA